MTSRESQQARSTGSVAGCTKCQAPIESTFYRIGGKALCPRCTHVARLARSAPADPSLFRGVLYGLAAAVAGASGYAAMIIFTGYEYAVVAVLVGSLIGFAVRSGYGVPGNWPVRVIAVVLTYCALTLSYVPVWLHDLRSPAGEQGAEGGRGVPAQALPGARKDGKESPRPIRSVEFEGERYEVRTGREVADDPNYDLIFLVGDREARYIRREFAQPSAGQHWQPVLDGTGVVHVDAEVPAGKDFLPGQTGPIGPAAAPLLAGGADGTGPGVRGLDMRTIVVAALIAPFVGLEDFGSILSLVLIASALFMAWRVAAYRDDPITGPFELRKEPGEE